MGVKCFELDVTNLPKHQHADQAMIQDLLTIRADRDNYYYGYQAILGVAKPFPVLLLSILRIPALVWLWFFSALGVYDMLGACVPAWAFHALIGFLPKAVQWKASGHYNHLRINTSGQHGLRHGVQSFLFAQLLLSFVSYVALLCFPAMDGSAEHSQTSEERSS